MARARLVLLLVILLVMQTDYRQFRLLRLEASTGLISTDAPVSWKALTHSKGVFEPCKKVESNNTSTDLLLSTKLGWDNGEGPPRWVVDTCPEVVEHLNKFPYFQTFPVKDGSSLPVATTEFTAIGLCTLKAIQQVASKLSVPVHLDAGSHLGAARHGEPVPWDDDIDVAIPYQNFSTFLNECNGMRIHPNATLICKTGYKCLKVYVEYAGMKTQSLPKGKYQWKAPFVDVFLYKNEDKRVRLMHPKKQRRLIPNHAGYPLETYLPLRPYYFGGLRILGPAPEWAEERYSFTECFLANYHHRYENAFQWQGLFDTLEVDCCKLAKRFPFVYRNGTLSDGRHQVLINVSLPVHLSSQPEVFE